jgi:high-affinity iron transporter
MIPSILLALREGLEAALMIGIVLGVLQKMNRPELKKGVWRGAAAAAGLSLVVALGLNILGAEFEGLGEQIFEGSAMLLAAGVLTWMVFWMRRQGRTLKKDIQDQASQALGQQGRRGIFALVFLMVFREGVELALYLLAARFASSPAQTLTGAAIGLAGAAVLGWMLFNSSRRLNLQQFFRVTNFLLIVFAAGMVGMAVHEFNEAGWIPAVIEHVWDINPILSDEAGLGAVLKTLFGYNGNPSLTSIIAYVGYFVFILTALRPRRLIGPAVAAG